MMKPTSQHGIDINNIPDVIYLIQRSGVQVRKSI